MSKSPQRKEGLLFMRTGLFKKKWKRYNFVLNQANFQYFKLHEVNNTKGQIVVSDISKIEIVETQSAAGFPFAVHFSGHESPWTLYAASEDERKNWMDTLELVVKWPVRESKQLSGVRRVKTQLESSRVVSDDPRDKHVGQQLFHHRVSLHTGPPMSDAVALCSGVCNNGTYDYHNASEDTCSTHRYIEMQPRLDTSSSISSILCEDPTLLCSTEPEYEVMVKKPDYDPGYEIMQPAMNSDPAANHVEEQPKLTLDVAVPESTPEIVQLLRFHQDIEQNFLGTEYENVCAQRPMWAKANDVPEAITLSDIERNAIIVPPSMLSEYVPIGQGQFGKIFKATMFKGTQAEVLVAIKTPKEKSSGKEKDKFINEMYIMSKIVHPNIVRLLGLVIHDDQSPSIIFEYLPHGDLKNFLSKNHCSVQTLVKYMIDVAMGMHYISERRLIHRNLALRNVLVGENEVCRIADFGLFQELPKDVSVYHDQTLNDALLPLRWMAPESISGRHFSIASDVWSYGILMWEMFNPDLIPYHTMDSMECVAKVCKGYRLPKPEKACDILDRLMRASWHECPEKRPSFLLITTLLMTKGLEETKLEH